MKLYGGIRIGDDVIGITHMPDRKRPCLYYQNGNVIHPLAYFTSDEHADLFWEQLQRFTVRQTDCPWK